MRLLVGLLAFTAAWAQGIPGIGSAAPVAGGGGGGGTVAFVQVVTARTSAGTTFPISITPTSGNLLYVFTDTSSAGVTATVADTRGNTFTAIDAVSRSFDVASNFYSKNITGGSDTITVTYSAAVTSVTIVAEFSGASITAPLVSHNTGIATSGTVITSGSISGGSGNAVAAFASNYYAPAFTAGSVPAGLAIPTGGANTSGDGSGNAAFEHVTLSGAATSANINQTNSMYGAILVAVFG